MAWALIRPLPAIHFADGLIAFGGRALGGEQLATLDREAEHLLSAAGESVRLLCSKVFA